MSVRPFLGPLPHPIELPDVVDAGPIAGGQQSALDARQPVCPTPTPRHAPRTKIIESNQLRQAAAAAAIAVASAMSKTWTVLDSQQQQQLMSVQLPLLLLLLELVFTEARLLKICGTVLDSSQNRVVLANSWMLLSGRLALTMLRRAIAKQGIGAVIKQCWLTQSAT